MSSSFKQIYDQSINKPEEFWQNVSEDIFWFKKPTQILNKDKPPFYKWFCDGITNTCYNALDIHIDQGRGERIALIYDSPITGNKKKFTYNELKGKVSKFAGALKNQGVNKGDRVITTSISVFLIHSESFSLIKSTSSLIKARSARKWPAT